MYFILKEMDARHNTIGFLVDGFPRNYNNLDGWEKTMANKTKLHFVLYLSAPLDICVGRCLNRAQGRTDDNKVCYIFFKFFFLLTAGLNSTV